MDSQQLPRLFDRSQQATRRVVFADEKHQHPRRRRRELLEKLEPFAAQRIFHRGEAGDVAAGMRHARDKASLHRLDRVGEHHRDGSCGPADGLDGRCRHDHDRFRLGRHQGGSGGGKFRRVWHHPVVDLDVLTLDPAESLQFLLERRHTGAVREHVVEAVQDADAVYFAGLLRTRRCRPNCRAAKQRDELPSSHSITSSARPSIVAGTVMPSAFAVFRLNTISNLLAACTGNSPGLAPFRMRST